MSCRHVSDHRQLVHHSLMKFRDGKLFRAAGNQPGSFLRHNCRDETGLLQQFDPHSVSGVELLPLITRLGIIHAGIGEDPVHIGGEQADLPKNCGREMSRGAFVGFTRCHKKK